MRAFSAISAGKGNVQVWPQASPGLLSVAPVLIADTGTAHYMPVLGILSVSRSRHLFGIAENGLTKAEQARFHRFARPEDRARFVMGRYLAKSMLAEHYGLDLGQCDFAVNTYGKPLLSARPDIVFNIAHSGDLVLVGIGRGLQLGVDVELHRPQADLEAIAGQVFSACEQRTIFACHDRGKLQLFFEQWSLKEALVKALGTGFAADARRFAITQAASSLDVEFVGHGKDDIGKGWTIVRLDVCKGYSAAAAWRRRDDNPEQGFKVYG